MEVMRETLPGALGGDLHVGEVKTLMGPALSLICGEGGVQGNLGALW